MTLERLFIRKCLLGTLLVLSLPLAGCKKTAVNLSSLQPADDAPSGPTLSITPGQSAHQFLNSGGGGLGLSVTVTGTPPFTFEWTLNGSEDLSNLPFSDSSATFTPPAALRGDNTIEVTVSDTFGNTETYSWDVSVDQLEVSAVTANNLKFTTDYDATYSLAADTTNGQGLTYTWLLDGLPSASIYGSASAITLTTSSGLIGDHTLSATVLDGELSRTVSWNVQVNAQPQGCNTLMVGQMCTVAGMINIGDGEEPLQNPELFHVQPYALALDDLNNVIWSDEDSDYIWYWNRTAAAVTRFGQSIAAGQAKVVAGSGGSTSFAGTTNSNLAPIGLVYGLAYDNGKLYIAGYTNNRVYVLNSDGTLEQWFTGSATTHTGAVSTQGCKTPRDVVVHNGNLYVACSSTSATESRIKMVNLTTNAVSVVAGASAGAYSDGTSTATSFGLTDYPVSLWVDNDGLFYASVTHYLYYINASGGPKSFFGGASTNSGNVRRIAGTGLNAAPGATAAPLSYALGNIRDVLRIGEIFWITHVPSGSYISVLNNSGSVYAAGSTSINANFAMYVNTTSNGFNGNARTLNSTEFNYPTKLASDGSRIFVTDYLNYMLRSINLSSFTVEGWLGSGQTRVFAPTVDSELPGVDQSIKYPGSLAYNSTSQDIYIVDSSNGKLRRLDRFGRLSSVAGKNYPTTAQNSNNSPMSANLQNTVTNGSAGLDYVSGFGLIMVQTSNHVINAWNMMASSLSFAGQAVSSNRISTVAGLDGSTGNLTTGLTYGSASFNNPGGLVYRSLSGDTFVSDASNHCIKSISSSGTLSALAGTCGTSGPVVGARLSARMNLPRAMALDGQGNLFIADSGNSRLVYVNLLATDVSVLGVNVASNYLQVVKSPILTASGVAYLSNLNWVCVSSFSAHYVKCYDITSGAEVMSIGMSGIPGAPISSETSDGLSASAQLLNNPSGLMYDGTYLYISDTANGMIRKVRMN